MYSANETDREGADKEGTVSAFSINPTDGQLKLINTVRSGGAGPTYVSVHPSGKHLLVANYFGGSVAILPILDDGSLGAATDVKQDAGKVGPTKATNAPPGSFAVSGHDRTHAHMIQADPSKRFVLHVDLGLDKIFVWRFDDRKGTLTANDPPAVALPPGDGPRHFHFHPGGRWLYSIQEEGSTIVLFDFDAATGRLTARQNDLDAAARIQGQQLLLRDPGFGRRPVRLRRQSPARQHRDLFHRRGRYAQTHPRRVDARKLPSKFRLRPHQPVSLLPESAQRQRHRLPRRRQDRQPGLHRPLRPSRQSVEHRVSRTRQGEVNMFWLSSTR